MKNYVFLPYKLIFLCLVELNGGGGGAGGGVGGNTGVPLAQMLKLDKKTDQCLSFE